ncbi:aryl-sulfate sulfotransferase [Paraburkholderia sp. J8-2]|uniref:aryl-sulfate sulfotransferase n=1 Tax=Paraburkholderia sp. J8-2 TaxID=2805440 RepID=UPI002AB7CB5C|nr:aryl-sulfate sulfotransferase [Paraburkholderia sp. J8-2]
MKFRISCLAASLLSLAGSAFAVPSVAPTGVTVYDRAKAYPCDVLFSTDDATYLVDKEGKLVQKWPEQGFPSKMIDPKLVSGKKGVIGVQLSAIEVTDGAAGTGLVPGLPAGFRNKTFGLVDWNNKPLWKWGENAPGGAARQHHDWERLENGHMLLLTNVGRKIPGFGDRPMLDDVIREVDKDGNIVWSWSATDHLNEFGFTPEELELIKKKAAVDFLHTNDLRVLGPNRWAEAGDSRFAPDNILISSRDANFTVIIDKKTGHVVWRIGPDYPKASPMSAYRLPKPIDQISGQHDAYMIPEGVPGAGNILMLDNQGEAGYPSVELQVAGGSRVIEINPSTNQIVWQYTAAYSGEPDWRFFTPFMGGAQRLPNGNTLIDEAINGRFFEVTPQGEIVWEYVSPYKGSAPQPPVPGRPQPVSNLVYRIQAVPLSWVPDKTPATKE